MRRTYFIIYVMTVPKGLQKTKVCAEDLLSLNQLLAISGFVKHWFDEPTSTGAIKGGILRGAFSGRIKFVCWNYRNDLGRQPYIGLLSRALAFNKKEAE